MQTILVANPKGGSGKTTLATNVAGWLSGKRQHVALQDLDPQRSSAEWLARRPELFPRDPRGPARREVEGRRRRAARSGSSSTRRRASTATICATRCAGPTSCWSR